MGIVGAGIIFAVLSIEANGGWGTALRLLALCAAAIGILQELLV
jgi:hypothetical protein